MKLQLLIVTLYATTCWQIAYSMFVSHKNCNDQPVGAYVAHPSNCNQYIRCNGLRSTLGECPNGTFFNPLVLSCDKSKNACRALEATTVAAAAATTTTEIVELLQKEEEQEEEDEEMLEEEALTTTTQSISADSSDESNEDINRPLILNNNNMPYAAMFMNNAVAFATYVRPVCNPWFDQAFPYPSNCEYYYYCIRGFLTVRRCSFGYAWDMQRKICLPRHIARCWNL